MKSDDIYIWLGLSWTKRRTCKIREQSERKEPPFSSLKSLRRAPERTPVCFPRRQQILPLFFPRSLRELRTNTCGFPAGCPRSIESTCPHLSQ